MKFNIFVAPVTSMFMQIYHPQCGYAWPYKSPIGDENLPSGYIKSWKRGTWYEQEDTWWDTMTKVRKELKRAEWRRGIWVNG